ncbi:MAG TPA: DUF72 domain-containing protein [Bacteroidetes bacterium]|nr:DUF72 domain-containing protein [Bacteroidota bacterium]
MKHAAIYIGTSGYSYPHWRGAFYPDSVKPADYLKFYAANFNSVEINYSYYHIPPEKTVEKWAEETPAEFRFTLKANRRITHRGKLHNVEGVTKVMTWRMHLLGEKAGVLLFQLPPSFSIDLERLGKFLQILPTDVRCAFEFRNSSWFVPETFSLLESHQRGFCIVSAPEFPVLPKATAPFVYFRFHGRDKWIYYSYSDDELRFWAEKMRAFQEQGREVFAYFNNDPEANAVKNALRLKEILAEK